MLSLACFGQPYRNLDVDSGMPRELPTRCLIVKPCPPLGAHVTRGAIELDALVKNWSRDFPSTTALPIVPIGRILRKFQVIPGSLKAHSLIIIISK